ncbi:MULTISPECIES: hypothetical protein [Dietzia]|uniref:hypothetical protein n=1 Tax=Dietzia TaxID=37914 RepID=UPI0007811D0D|nr:MULTISPECIES: hypothetical protein [Dietzia]KZO58637.1 hypothetical protein A2U19_10780 [Dietzia maris]MCT1884493.1 hypothetical protein [Dietzia cinnamea]MCT2057545.1 hypothetical protein [Dietzia cinnamea]MCT2097731.1 hypothetical protein [Dietzia cinnamea]MCT2119887.1 hypothetical protein [Dietzia cinnamea]
MISIRSLDLSAVDHLGPRARRCVYWQTDGESTSGSPGDPEFEKEAWISHVSLEWGVCGQIARAADKPAAAAFYAPPGMIPRASCFPTSPVGADAILLAGMSVEDGAPAGVLTSLLDAVVVDLRSRGIKAIEAFGVTSEDAGEIASRDTCGADSCVPATSFLIEHGFTIIAPHETHPRLRLDIQSEHLWKADVERALDQLFAEHGFATRRVGVLSGASARA